MITISYNLLVSFLNSIGMLCLCFNFKASHSKNDSEQRLKHNILFQVLKVKTQHQVRLIIHFIVIKYLDHGFLYKHSILIKYYTWNTTGVAVVANSSMQYMHQNRCDWHT